MSKETALIFVETRPDLFRRDFAEWLAENWHIYVEFSRRADRLRDLGRDHMGSRAIWESIRYDTATHEINGEFRLNNIFAPDCARLWSLFNPKHAQFFERRSGQSAVRAI